MESPTLRVSILSHSAALGGAERSLLEMASLLEARGHHSFIVLPSEGPLLTRITELGIRSAVVPFRWWMSDRPQLLRRLARIVTQPLAARRIAREIRFADSDVLVTNGLTVVAGALAARRLGIPHVWYLREFGWKDHGFRFDLGRRLSYRIMNSTSRSFIANSHALAAFHEQGLPGSSIRVLHQPVLRTGAIPASGPDVAPDPPEIVMAAALRPEKGQESAIHAVALLRKRGNLQIRLRLLGDGPPDYRNSLEELAGRLGIADSVRFEGTVEDPRPQMLRARAVLNCSRSEAYGRTTAEAMRLGRAVIVAAAGGSTELVTDGVTGLTYEPGQVEALAECVGRILNEHGLAERLGQAAGEWVQRELDPDRYSSGLEEILRSATERATGS